MRARKIKPSEARLERSPETLVDSWEECRPYLRQAAGQLVRNHSDLDDILQEAFLRAQKGRYVAKKGAFVTWAGTIVVRTACDHSRRRLRKIRRNGEKVLKEVSMPDCFEDVTAATEWIESSIEPCHIRQALGQMHDDQRDLLIGIYLQGISYKVIADSKGIPLGTVKSQLSRAIKNFVLNLQEILGDNAPRFVAARLRSYS